MRHLTSKAAGSMSDPDCRETDEKTNHQLNMLGTNGPFVTVLGLGTAVQREHTGNSEEH